MAAQSNKGLFVDGPNLSRVEIPRNALVHFTNPEVHMIVEKAAEVLGFKGEAEFRKYVEPLLKKTDGVEPLGTHVGALSFKRLVAICAPKTKEARKILEEFLLGGQVVDLPCVPTVAQGAVPRWPGCAPEAVQMDGAPFERLHQYFQWRTRMRHFAGISCGVVKNGMLVYYQDAGYADVEKKTKMSSDTFVRLFSMTKCLVAAAFCTYLEDPSFGVDFDDPVSKYIPAFEASNMSVLPKRGQKDNQPLERPITLRQLLTHTSGMGYGATLGDPWPPAKGSYYKIYEELSEQTKSGAISNLEDWCNALAKVPLKGQPGQFWDYSYSLDVLGRVLEVISGKPLDVVLEERICGPLKMRDTRFDVPAQHVDRLGPWYQAKEVEGKPNLAHQLEIVDKGGLESGWVGNNVASIKSAGGTVDVPLSIKGGMVSTFNDYLRFLLMLRNLGELDGVRVLKRETVQLMVCNHIPVACNGKKTVFVFDKPGMGYSCVGSIQSNNPKQDKGTVSGGYGWGGLAGPAWTIDPRSDLIVLSMTQTALVLDHEEYLRYTARRATSSYYYGNVTGPSKATSYHPECFDVIKPKAEAEKVKEDPNTDREFEEEHRINTKTRVRGAKECAILPGARLDRHPSDEMAEANKENGGRKEIAEDRLDAPEAATPAAKRPRRSNQETPSTEGLQKGGSSPPSGNKKENKPQALFSGVALQTQGDDEIKKTQPAKKPRKTAEVATEKDRPEKAKLKDVVVADETQLGTPATPENDDVRAPTPGDQKSK